MRHVLYIVFFGILCFSLHSANYDREYLLDSHSGLINNPAVRSLANIPDYFLDCSTLTSLRQNWDYRPILQITYALNYWVSGYAMWSWHLLQVIFHFVCTIGVYFLCQRILAVFKPLEDRELQRTIAFVTALIFAIHPSTSGVVNYLWARSSLLTGVFLLFSMYTYIGKYTLVRSFSPPWTALLLYTLALFTKVEAVALLGVFWVYEVVVQGGDEQRKVNGEGLWGWISGGFLGDVVRSLNMWTLRRLWPFLLITLVYAIVREQVVHDFLVDARHRTDVTPYSYFLTQLTAWWFYIYQWFVPIDLVADNLAYPVFRSLLEPEVMLAISGWGVVALFLAGNYRRHPEYMFVCIAALAIIFPTSSISPLAEMVNEHRPYIPLAILSMLWIAPACRILENMISKGYLHYLQVIVVLLVVLVPLYTFTLQRNRVFTTGENYWYDIIQKAPSARAHVNYGLKMRHKGELDTAMVHFQKSLDMAPHWHVTHINLAISYEIKGDSNKALHHFNQAVAYEMYGSRSLEYRGNYYLRTGRYKEAVADFEKSLEKTTDSYLVYKGIAQGASGQGDWQKAVDATRQMCDRDPQKCEYEIVAISTPYWGSADLYGSGIKYFESLVEVFPDSWWVYHNIADLAKKTGNWEVEKEAVEREMALRNGKAVN